MGGGAGEEMHGIRNMTLNLVWFFSEPLHGIQTKSTATKQTATNATRRSIPLHVASTCTCLLTAIQLDPVDNVLI